jgi:hypothetical protein
MIKLITGRSIFKISGLQYMDVEINLINQFKALPENWNAWLLENLERGCHPEDLAKILLQEGLIELNPVKLMAILKMSKIIIG